MTLAFDPAAAEGLAATIQFDVTGPEPGVYHLRIADGECTFHPSPAAAPTLTISTPSDVWLAIARKELSGARALMTGKYKAKGKMGLLMKMDKLFSRQLTVADIAATGLGRREITITCDNGYVS